LKWTQVGEDEDDDEIAIIIEELPEDLPCDYAWSFKIQILDEAWNYSMK
jgi:hypothetical protein